MRLVADHFSTHSIPKYHLVRVLVSQLNTYNGVVLMLFAVSHNGFRVFVERFRMRKNESSYARIALIIPGIATAITVAHMAGGLPLAELLNYPIGLWSFTFSYFNLY